MNPNSFFPIQYVGGVHKLLVTRLFAGRTIASGSCWSWCADAYLNELNEHCFVRWWTSRLVDIHAIKTSDCLS